MNYKIVNVIGDGSCFFRSIYKYLKYADVLEYVSLKLNNNISKVTSQNDFVILLRIVLSKIIKNQDDSDIIKNVYNTLSEVDKETYSILIESFPQWFIKNFKKLPNNEGIFRNKISKEIKEITNWAGEIEVKLVEQLFYRLFKFKLVIINSTNLKKEYKFKNNTIYLLNGNEVHYNAILPNIKPQFSIKINKTRTCPEGKILNTVTNRCVLKQSCTGLKVLVIKNNLL